MKRTLAILLVAVASAALAQTPTVVEKPAAKSASPAKATAKTPAHNTKPSPTTVKVVPAQKPVTVVAKPTAVPAHAAIAKAVAVPAARANALAPAKPVAVAAPAKSVVVAAPAAQIAVVSAKPATASNAPKLVAVPVKADPFKSSAAPKVSAKVNSKPVAVTTAVKGKSSSTSSKTTVAVQDNKPTSDNKTAKAVNTAGRRDPFVSPVVTLGATGSGCSSGKRCLAIDQVALRGVVRSDGGMIAVVVNAMDKAYFLRENDPVFNGYVLKITGDSIVFKETFHDKLGKPLTRDVTKTIIRPVA
jgi:Tfp pilus assembly protein PilP